MSRFADDLRARIDAEYRAGGYEEKLRLRWRLLASPIETIWSADVVFLSLNPAGRAVPADHPELAPATGSAYVEESWDNRPAGQSVLQMQIQALFGRIGVEPTEVLAGHIVPFRSRRWKDLPDEKRALDFGMSLWRRILFQKRRELIVTMGRSASSAALGLLGTVALRPVPVNWGNVRAWHGRSDYGRVVALPHLSTFKIMMRPKSEHALATLFPGAAR